MSHGLKFLQILYRALLEFLTMKYCYERLGLRKYNVRVHIGFIWLRIGSSFELLWTRSWTFGYHEYRDFLNSWATIIFSRRPLFHGVTYTIYFPNLWIGCRIPFVNGQQSRKHLCNGHMAWSCFLVAWKIETCCVSPQQWPGHWEGQNGAVPGRDKWRRQWEQRTGDSHRGRERHATRHVLQGPRAAQLRPHAARQQHATATTVCPGGELPVLGRQPDPGTTPGRIHGPQVRGDISQDSQV
jgi:hypothetical protein